MLSLPRRGCSLLHKPMRRCVNPLGGEPLTGEPDAGNPPVRFGGRGSKTNRLSLPLSNEFSHRLYRSRFCNYHLVVGNCGRRGGAASGSSSAWKFANTSLLTLIFPA